jgi:chorismate mutase
MSNIQKLKDLRSQIDIIDSKLLELLNQRKEISAEIGDIKKSLQKEIFDRNREAVIFKKMQAKCDELNIDYDYIKNIWNIILNKSHEIQIEGK